MIHIYRGYHSHALITLMRKCLEKSELLVLVPGHMTKMDFVKWLPGGEAELHGEFSERHLKWEPNATWNEKQYPQLALFTSGSVRGEPRLVFYSRSNFMSSLESIRKVLPQGINSIFCYPQPTHCFGAILGYIHAIEFGLRLFIPEGKYSRTSHEFWFQNVNSGLLTLGTPVHFFDLIQAMRGRKPSASLTSICGGAPVSPELWRQMRDHLQIAKPSIGYGATEASPGLTHSRPGIEPLQHGEIGEPLKGLEIQISDRGLEFSGPNLCYAYVDATNGIQFPKTMIIKDRIEVRDSARALVFGGRLELTLNRGGVKYSLEDLEASLNDIKKVPAIAVSVESERLGEDLGLVFEGAPSLKSEIHNWLKEKFLFDINDDQMVPVKELPRSLQGKLDREFARRIVKSAINLQYPVPIERLFMYLPHRPPAVWVDDVVSVDEVEGVCGVTLDSSKNYYTNESFRSSAFIEWMAQSYAYIRACQGLSGLVSQPVSPRHAYLVALKNIEFLKPTSGYQPGERLFVRVRKTHHVGPVSMINGQVEDKTGAVLCRGQLKIFAS